MHRQEGAGLQNVVGREGIEAGVEFKVGFKFEWGPTSRLNQMTRSLTPMTVMVWCTRSISR
jgi:hypothetical protein